MVKNMKNKIENKLFYFTIIVFGFYFIIRLIDESALIHTFPLDYANDISSYIAQLHFLKVCGFHQMCYYWYNGFNTFLITPPAWYFFTLPIYLLIKNILLSTYISMIVIYILGLIGFIFMGKLNKISYIKSLGLFFLFFANPISIGEFIKLGRLPSLFSWVIIIFLFSILLYYKDRPLDKYFLFFIPLYSLLILSHFQEVVLFSFILLGFFLIKTNKEKICLVFLSTISLLIASFWFIPFILNAKNSGLSSFPIYKWLLNFSGNDLITNLISFVIIIIFFCLFYLNWLKENKSKKELLFYLPSLILGFLVFTRLVVILPIFNSIAPDPYIYYFILLSLYLFVKLEFNKKILKLIRPAFVLLILISVLISAFNTPWFIEHTQLERDTTDLITKYVDGNYLIFGGYPTSYAPAYYAYTSIFYNLSSASGWCNQASTKNYIEDIQNLYNSHEKGNCEQIKFYLNKFNVTQIIGYTDSGYGDDCAKLNNCSFKFLENRKNVCIYEV